MIAQHAPPAAPASTAQSLREVRRGVAEAGDAQVLKVLRMVDALEDRGATDAVLEPVRSRLRAIQPVRPLRFARLLFMPLDPLIVAPKDWRPGTPFLPRTALMVLAKAVRLSMLAAGEDQAERLGLIDGLIAGASTAQTCVVRKAGGLLWPVAAAALRHVGSAPDDAGPNATCLEEWSAEGLARAELRPTALALASILAHAVALHDHDHAGAGMAKQTLLDMLAAAEPDGPRAWGMLLGLLVIRVPQAATALLTEAQARGSLRPMAETASEAALSWIETETADQTGGIAESAPLEVARQAALLDALAKQPGDPARRRRVADAKSHLLAGCLHRYEASLQDQVAGALSSLPANAADRDRSLDGMEETARTLRRFEIEARRLGASAKFDALAQSIERSVAVATELSRMDRARLLEILSGPDAAARLMMGA